MAIRHRRPPRLGRSTRRTLIGVALLALLVPLTVVALRIVLHHARDCTGELTLEIAAAPAIVPALRDIAAELPRGVLRVHSDCVRVSITEAPSAAVARTLAASRGRDLDVGSVPVGMAAMPHVWIPESRAWTLRVEDASDAAGPILAPYQPSAAYDPVGLSVANAATPIALDAWNPADLSVGAVDPRADAASLAALAAFGNAGVDKGVGTFAALDTALASADAVPMSALELAAHNRAHPERPRVLVETRPAITGFDYPYAMRADLSARLSRAAEKFLTALSGAEGLACLAEMGLQPPDEYRPVLTRGAVVGVLGGA
ncbi:hypothetical protein Afil01_19720 [Actinorhabdospora filicis]|uniref:Uncharacterized protein n=1 Tax=Actinorhabdospora filicis TaxID=1785913 RepID=A0A9W6WA11_9ACTN|nr:substrate-binding domain-containing protein [Actinorhabdospora filicis]GLZ77165.1 hypothetical protein Afil01_19720 [Actinorhabdospora filicis]